MSKVMKDIRVQKALLLSKTFGLNEYQTETMVNAAMGTTLELLNTITSKEDAIYKIIVPYNTLRLNKQMRERIEQGHYSVMGVGGGNVYWPTLETPIEYGESSQFAYTIGISRRDGLDHELFTYGPPDMINEIVERYPTGVYPTEAIESMHYDIGGKPARMLVLKIVEPKKLVEHYFARIDQWLDKTPSEFYLVCVGDENNLLPGEPGYVRE